MTRFAKVLLGLALGLPMGAYAVGSLVSSAADEPVRRAPIILEDAATPPQGTVPGATLRPSPGPSRTADPDQDGPEDDERDDREEGRSRPEVVVPTYVDRGDDDDDDGGGGGGGGDRDDTRTDDRDDSDDGDGDDD